jgi:hypothetical protein
MTQSFTDATFGAGDYSAGAFLISTFTGSSVLSALNVTSVSFTGTLTTPGILSSGSLTLNTTGTPIVATNVTYVGFINATDGSGDPTYILTADVAGIGTPVAFAITTDPNTPLSLLSLLTGVDTSAVTAPPSTDPNPPCYVTGTRVLTTLGEVAVEDLAVGDLVVTAAGEARPITWIGYKRIERPMRAQRPVRVLAGAFGDGLPTRDLMLSPGHAVCVDVMGEVFVPIDNLINGATVAQVEVDEVTYWHVELESHDVLLAEGLPAESYMDIGNRAWFGREYGRLEKIDPERVEASLAAYARPFVANGPIVEAICQRLAARAETLGWARSSEIDLHLTVDGQRLEAELDGELARFIFPATATAATLVSRTFVPAGRSGNDRRTLGVRLDAVKITDGLRLDREVALESLAGVHHEEAALGVAWRWTDGQLDLPAQLWAEAKGKVILTLAHRPKAVWTWVAPEVSLAASLVRAA